MRSCERFMCKSPDLKITRMTIDHGLKSKNNKFSKSYFYIYKKICISAPAEGKFVSKLLVRKIQN